MDVNVNRVKELSWIFRGGKVWYIYRRLESFFMVDEIEFMVDLGYSGVGSWVRGVDSIYFYFLVEDFMC